MERDIPAHFVDQLLRNHQPKPGAAVTARNTGIGLAKRLKQSRLVALWNADPRIADLHFNLHFGVTERPLFYQNIDIAALGELNGITHQISNDLLQAQRVADHIIRDVVFNI